MSKPLYIVVTAGGSGTRMGSEVPKQFLQIGGKPVLRRTMERLSRACPGARFITVLPRAHMDWWRRYCDEAGFNCPQTLVCGGITRFHSVRNALARVPDGAVVAIHDGVRPFVSEALVQRMLEMMEDCEAVVPVCPSTDTLVLLETAPDGVMHSSGGPAPDRSRIFAVQTPQMFRSEGIKAAYGQAYDPLFTDDGSVAARYGIPLSYVTGERFNIKITTPEDLPLAEFIAERRSL